MEAAIQAANALPKVELHVHIEGTLEPALAEAIRKQEGTYDDGEFYSLLSGKSSFASSAKYDFQNLREFLALYYANCSVLKSRNDFWNLSFEYFKRAAADNVVHTEIFFDPQTHLNNGVPFKVLFEGIRAGAEEGKKRFGISYGLVMSFLRDLSVESAMSVIEMALPYKDHIVAVGLDSAEVGHPCRKFTEVFRKCSELGWKTVAHAGEEGPASNIVESIELLKVSRVDHGIRVLEDQSVLDKARNAGVIFTVCPLSNVSLKAFPSLRDHPLRKMISAGIRVTINSDDPSYFGGYISANFEACIRELGLTTDEVVLCIENSVDGCFASEKRKIEIYTKIQQVKDTFQ